MLLLEHLGQLEPGHQLWWAFVMVAIAAMKRVGKQQLLWEFLGSVKLRHGPLSTRRMKCILPVRKGKGCSGLNEVIKRRTGFPCNWAGDCPSIAEWSKR